MESQTVQIDFFLFSCTAEDYLVFKKIIFKYISLPNILIFNYFILVLSFALSSV